MKKAMVGICEVCGNIEIRPAPADTAICQKCYSHNSHVVLEIKLKTPGEILRQVEVSKHPDFVFEFRGVPIVHVKGVHASNSSKAS